MDFEGRRRIHSHLDIAPLIDIVFLLLVFFMLTSTFIVQEAVELELPESKSSSKIDTTPIIISLDKAGQLAINDEIIELHLLRSLLKTRLKQSENPAITLKSDAKVEVQQLLNVMDEIRAAGGSNIALATMSK